MFHRHGQKIVMIARFLPGVRAVTYFTAGSAGMSFTRFIFFDGLAALASAPLFVWLGYHFGGELELLTDKLKDGQTAVLVALGVAIVGYLLYRRRANQRARLELAEGVAPTRLPHERATPRFSEGAPAEPKDVAENGRPFAEPHPPLRRVGVGE